VIAPLVHPLDQLEVFLQGCGRVLPDRVEWCKEDAESHWPPHSATPWREYDRAIAHAQLPRHIYPIPSPWRRRRWCLAEGLQHHNAASDEIRVSAVIRLCDRCAESCPLLAIQV